MSLHERLEQFYKSRVILYHPKVNLLIKPRPPNLTLEKRGRGLKRRAEDAEGEGRGEGRGDHVFAVPKTPSPVPRGRRKAGLRPQRREVVKYGEPEVRATGRNRSVQGLVNWSEPYTGYLF